LAARALVVRQRLESRGLQAQATVTTYRFVAGGQEHTGSGSANRKYRVGESIDVIYDTSRPSFNQLVSGGVATSIGLNLFVMAAMVATEIWLAARSMGVIMRTGDSVHDRRPFVSRGPWRDRSRAVAGLAATRAR
jgi:hypothetical protein